MTITRPAVKLIGVSLGFKTTNENGKAAEDCDSLWQTFSGGFMAPRIKGKLNKDTYAVYYDYDGDYTKPYAYFIGCPVADDAEVPTGMETITIPEQNYEVVTAKGQMPKCIGDTWHEIWKEENRNRAYGYDFEIYSEKAADWNNAEVDIFLSVS
ncbi:GyrI-like domain-containing protein [Flavobacterium sp. AG291]|uniref:GyrI-like domain-containing protein n=1 Tax=Flavobacterium sp. AG291 TaxID=2184000 RepID=UPI000E0A8E45|nr:GyrI-like domain-containing protein [Flavobacterium sp. AG291]RDI09819.1 putative transcriptional regulator YdeE [Flavobacterium sp. AG291]